MRSLSSASAPRTCYRLSLSRLPNGVETRSPHRIITPLHVIAPAMLSRLRPPLVVAPLLLLGFAPPLVVAFSLSLEICCFVCLSKSTAHSPPTSHSSLPTFSTLGTECGSTLGRHCTVDAAVGLEGNQSSEARRMLSPFCQVVAMEKDACLAGGARC